jgi:hypothetical protein
MLDAGAIYVMRAAQSKGKVDLLAVWPGACRIWLVQCKTGTARMSPADRHDLIELALHGGATAVLAQPGKNGRGVQFIDLHNDKEIQL